MKLPFYLDLFIFFVDYIVEFDDFVVGYLKETSSNQISK